MKNNTITGERLKECRIAAGYKKQEDVAKILNVQRQIISYYETGERFPKVDDLVKLAKLYNTSTDYLLGLSDVATTDVELKAICEYTGLTEAALKNLRALTTKEDKKYLINFLLSDSSFNDILYHFSMHLKEYFYAVISLSSSIKSGEYCKTLSIKELKKEKNNIEKVRRNLLEIAKVFKNNESKAENNLERVCYHLTEHKKKAEEATRHIKDARYHLFETVEALKVSIQNFNPFLEKYWELLGDYSRTYIIDIDDLIDCVDEWLLYCSKNIDNSIYENDYPIPSETFANQFDERFDEILSIFKVGDFKWQP